MNYTNKYAGQVFYNAETGTGNGTSATVAPAVAAAAAAAAAAHEEDEDGDEIIVGNKARTVSKYEQKLRAENATKRATIKANETRHAAEIADLRAQMAARETLAKTEREAAVSVAMKGVNDRITQSELKATLVAAGVVDANAGLKLIDASGISVDEAGVVKGVSEAVAKLKADSAFLFVAPTTSTTATAKAPAPAETFAKQAKDMTKEEWSAAERAYTRAPVLKR